MLSGGKVLIGLNILRKHKFDNRMSSMRGGSESSGPSQAMVMFEETVSKSFQIIKALLPKINSLYQLNEQLERSVSNVERKLTKLEMDNQDLHYELRTNKLALETKVSAIATQYNLLANEYTPSRRYIDSARSRQKITERKEEDCDSPVDGKVARQKDRTRKIIFEDQVVRKEGRKRSLKRRNSIDLEQDEARVHFNLHSNVSIDTSQPNIGNGSERTVFASERNIKAKNNTKNNAKEKRQDVSHAKSSKSIKSRKEEKQTSNYASFLREIENYHFNNKKMKENYQNLMDQYCRQNDSKFTALKTQIDGITSKLQLMDPHNNLLQLIQSNSHIELTQHLQEFKTRLTDKLDASIFQTAFKELAIRLDSAHETIRKLANKDQTRRAIECLEDKLNFVLTDHPPAPKQKNQSIHTVELDMKGCLKSTSTGHDSHHHSRHTLRNHPAENTPRTLRNDERVIPKRLITSLHANIPIPTHSETRNNEGRLSLIVQKSDQLEETTVRLIRNSVMREREVNLLKQKSVAVLEAGKGKPKPRLRKERLIFQYD